MKQVMCLSQYLSAITCNIELEQENKRIIMNGKTIRIIIFCGTVFAGTVSISHANSFAQKNGNRTVSISIGQVNVKANELVYCQPTSCTRDYKVSQLIWDVRNITMLNTALVVRMSPLYTLSVNGRIAVNKTIGVMDDYDWVYTNRDWSDWSHHEDTKLTEATGFNINLDYQLFGENRAKLLFRAGYKVDTWAWESRGGTYIYSSTNKFRDLSGSFTPGELVISYRQQFRVPYLGFKYELLNNKWRFNFEYDYSDQVTVLATDRHYLRNLIFTDSFEKSTMNAYKLSLGYQLAKNFDIHFLYDVQIYDEARGSTVTTNDTTGVVTATCSNCAGADNSSNAWSIGTTYTY